jgi:hypothetical protein
VEKDRSDAHRAMNEHRAATERKIKSDQSKAEAASTKFLKDEARRQQRENEREQAKEDAARSKLRSELLEVRRLDDARIKKEAGDSAMASRKFARDVKAAEERRAFEEETQLRAAIEAEERAFHQGTSLDGF